MVGGASVIMQYKFLQSFVFFFVPPIRFIDRVLDITVMVQRQVCSSCKLCRRPRFLVQFLAGVAHVVVQRQVLVG